MIPHDIWWYLMIPYDTRWCLMIPTIPDSEVLGNHHQEWITNMIFKPSWYLTIPDDTWWYLMVPHDTWWYLMILDDTSLYLMILDDTLWYMMIPDDTNKTWQWSTGKSPLGTGSSTWFLKHDTWLYLMIPTIPDSEVLGNHHQEQIINMIFKPSWYLTIPDDTWWYLMILDDTLRYMMIPTIPDCAVLGNHH
jgi:hypothetical protein